MAAEASQRRALELAREWEVRPGERSMLASLLGYLTRTRRIGTSTLVALEVPWRGRRIDLATMSGGGITSAFELKREASARVFEQAIYNRQAVHRSWVVVPTAPSARSLQLADEVGVGVVQVNGRVRIWTGPNPVSDHRESIALRTAIERAAHR